MMYSLELIFHSIVDIHVLSTSLTCVASLSFHCGCLNQAPLARLREEMPDYEYLEH